MIQNSVLDIKETQQCIGTLFEIFPTPRYSSIAIGTENLGVTQENRLVL